MLSLTQHWSPFSHLLYNSSLITGAKSYSPNLLHTATDSSNLLEITKKSLQCWEFYHTTKHIIWNLQMSGRSKLISQLKGNLLLDNREDGHFSCKTDHSGVNV